jgi:hypothetical protein
VVIRSSRVWTPVGGNAAPAAEPYPLAGSYLRHSFEGTFHGFPTFLLVTLTPEAKEAAWDPTKGQKSMTWATFSAFAGIMVAN